MITASVLWRRVDTPGHDACHLERSDVGWILDGTTVFRHDGVPARLNYHVASDLEWRTQSGHVHGWLGMRFVEFRLARSTEGVWTLNAATVLSAGGCVDLDLGFTPATNLLPLRRLALAEGQAADAPAAWFNLSTGTLEILPQRYERRAETTFWYEAPGLDYAALLEVTPVGFICRYPGLWEEEP